MSQELPEPHAAGQRPDESDLVRRLKAGDDLAFEEMVREHAGRMLAVARRILDDADEAQDALQEAFLSAFRAIDRFEENARLGTWLHRIVVNAALMRRRRRKTAKEVAIEELLPSFDDRGHHVSMPKPWVENSEDVLVQEEMRHLVRQSIDKLPDNYREVLVLRDLVQLDTKETADMLGISPNAVKVRLHRAHVALLGLLDPHLRKGDLR